MSADDEISQSQSGACAPSAEGASAGVRGFAPAPVGQRRRVIIAGGAGTLLEWFDWSVFVLFATYFAANFFPSSSELTSLLATFSVFAVGFLARPIGGVLLGRISDRQGRKAALSTSVIVMAMASLGIAALPTYAQIGVLAAVFLTALRLIQGFSLGGETAAVGAYLVESAPMGHRGRFGAVYPFSVMLGTLLGSITGLVLTLNLSEVQMQSWGWRIPFVIGGGLGLLGYLIRRGAFEPLAPDQICDPSPIRRTFTSQMRTTVVVLLVVGATGLSFFGLIAGFPALAKFYGVTSDDAFAANTTALFLMAVLVPVVGVLSDRWGRKPFAAGGLIGLAILVVPAVWLLSQGHAMYSQVLIVLPMVAVQAVLLVSMIERFPTNLRGSGFGLVWALGVALVGGTGPLISTWLQTRGWAWAFPWYVAAWCGAAGLIVLAMREGAFRKLE